MSSSDPSASTHDRILDGAMHAIAKHGLAKLAMRDVGEAAGVARGTVYRHFANRDALLAELGAREAARFMGRWQEELSAQPLGEPRIRAVLEYPARFAAQYPILQRLIESDPDYVLRAIREYYPVIKSTVDQLVGPMFAENPLVKAGIVRGEQILDLFVRIMISSFLFPGDEPEALGRDLSSVYRAMRASDTSAS